MFLFGLSSRQRDCRNLASAFIGEIVAVMDVVEKHVDLHGVETGDDGAASRRIADLQLPRFVVYEANVGKLDLFNAPLPRELSYFYTRLAALPLHLRMLQSLPAPDDERYGRQGLLDDIADTMQLGDDLLRSIKSAVAHEGPPVQSRM